MSSELLVLRILQTEKKSKPEQVKLPGPFPKVIVFFPLLFSFTD